ncbi:protein takeout-like [Zophobas morio]|uniref:protein takeout-like n=1 Tax=Zophobas morio TaxID=2755281 RepID=UPI00308312A4
MTLKCLLASFIHVCHKSDPDLEQCLMKSVEEIRPHLVKGAPEYNIPSLEPLIMQELISEEAVGMKILTTNVSAYGCSDFIVKGINVDLDKQVYELHIDIPKLRIEADYTVDGKLLLLPVRGNGNLEANVTDCVSTCILQGELYEKDGETYSRFITIDLKTKVGGGHVRLENLFNGDKVILGLMNDVINKNLDAFLQELMPVIDKALGHTFLQIANDIVSRWTLNQLFPQ